MLENGTWGYALHLAIIPVLLYWNEKRERLVYCWVCNKKIPLISRRMELYY